MALDHSIRRLILMRSGSAFHAIPVIFTKASPKSLIADDAFVFCSPVGVDSIPAISAKLMIAFRTDARPYNRNFLFATTTHDFYCLSLSLILPNYKRVL